MSTRHRKGQLVAIQKFNSYYQIGDGHKTTESWHVGCVWKTNRAGDITHVFTSPTPPTSRPGNYDTVMQYDQVLTIPEGYDEAARWLAARSTTREWFPAFCSQQTLVDAIKDVQARIDTGNLDTEAA